MRVLYVSYVASNLIILFSTEDQCLDYLAEYAMIAGLRSGCRKEALLQERGTRKSRAEISKDGNVTESVCTRRTQ